MLEVYQAYGNYETMMDLTEKIILNAVEVINSASAAAKFTSSFARKKYDDLIKE
jgi:lysyl-tRNA synthetase class 2